MVELAQDLGWTKSRNARNAWRYGGNSLPSEMIALEPRVMLDGAAAVAAFAEADDQPAESADNAAAGDASADPAAQAANSESDNGGNNSESADTGQAGSTGAQSVIIIDASIADAESLLTGVDPSAHIFYLNAGSDGIQQITNILAGFSNVSDLHILSHGSTGSITLGATTVDASNIESYASQFVEWDVALTEGADILLYGCNVGQDDAGMDFIDLFADLTNADVAASTDLTGSADLGGNWQLEVGTGSIEATLPFSESAQNAYDHVLAPPVISNFDGGATHVEGGSPRRIDGDIEISDVESDALNGGNGDYAGAGFVLERTGGGNADDFIQFATDRGVRLAGADITETATGDRFGTIVLINGTVTVNFNSIDTPATTALVNATLQSFFYSNRSDTPPSQVTLDLTFTDSDGEVAVGTTQAVINITATDDATTVSDLPTSLDFTEDTPLGNFDISAATFADVDSPSISVTIEVAAGGTFTLADPAGLITVAGDGTDFITLTGAPADINTYLNTPANVRYSPPQDLNGTPATTATVTANGDTLGTIDINIAPVSDDPEAVDDSVATDADLAFGEDDGVRDITADILGNDNDPDTGDVLTVSAIDTTGTTGLVTLVGGVVTYDPNGAFESLAAGTSVVDTFTYTISDGNGGTDTATVSITINGANDAPVNTVPGPQATDEDTPLTLTGFSVADAEGDILRTTVSVGNGLLTVLISGIFPLTLQSVTLIGTPADINAVLATLVYTPNSDFTGTDTLTVRTTDNGASDTDTVDITVNPVNDAPVNDVPALAQVIDEDTALVFSAGNGNQLSITDVDAAGGTVSTVLAVASGILAVTTGGGANILEDGTDTVTITGTVAQVNAALATVTYTPTLDVNGADTLTMTTNDNGNTGSGGAQTDNDTVDITINPVNDAPEFTGLPANLTVLEDITTSVGLAGAIVSDVDNAQISLTVSAGAGTIRLVANGNTFNLRAVSLVGTPAQINAVLATFQYTGATNANGADTLTFVANDGLGGITTQVIDVAITSVNDEPAGTDATLTIDEDVPRTFSAADFGFTDTNDTPADGLANVIITTLPVSGTLTLNGMAVMAGQVIPASEIGNLVYIPAADVNGAGAASFTFQVQDDGGTANGGVDTDQTPNTLTIDITPVNDAPVNNVSGQQVINEDTTLVFSAGNGNQLSIADVDAVAGTVSTVLNVASGTLTVTPTVGANIVGGGTNTVTITGTVVQVNAALATVTYSTPLNFNGADTLTVTTNDNGNTGTGGALTDIDTVDITINPVNDAPVNSVPGTQNTDNNVDLVFSAANGNRISISDVDGGTGTMTTILAVPSGALTAAAGSGAIIAGNGSANVTISGTLAQVNAALSLVTYTPDGLTVGTIALTVTTNDNGNIGGGNLIDSDQIAIEQASGLVSTGTDGQNPSDPTGQSGDNQPSNFSDTPGNPIGFQNGNPGQDPLLAGLPGFSGGRPIDDIITAGIGDRTSGENGVSESDLPGNIDLHPTSDTGFSNLDDITADTTPLLIGKAPANTIVTIKSSLGGILGTVTADENGQWRYSSPSLSDGVHEFIATPTDEDGNEGVPSIPLLVTIDTAAPDTPPGPVFDGDVDQLRSNETPTFKGKAESGARIVLTSDPDGVVGEVVADENGNWQVTTGLSENTHKLTITATDAAGNSSPASPALELVVRGEDDTALNFDAISPVLADITGVNGLVGLDASNITALLSGFADQVDVSQFEPIRSGETAQAMGFTRQLQKAGNTVNDNSLASL